LRKMNAIGSDSTGNSNITVVRHRNTTITGAPTTFTVTFGHDFASPNPKKKPQPIITTGGFDLKFDSDLGGLAGVKTTGSVIPLVGLFASAAFGINLKNPTQGVQVVPGTFQAGPRVDVRTVAEGGKSITVQRLREGVAANATTGSPGIGEVQVLTVRAGSESTSKFS